MGWFNKKDEKQFSHDFAHITHEMYKQNVELAERNKTLMLLQKIDEAVLGSAAVVTRVTQVITDLLVHESDFSVALIYISDHDGINAHISGLSSQKQVSTDVMQSIANQLKSIALNPQAKNVLSEVIANSEVKPTDRFNDFQGSITPEDNQFLKDTLDTQTLFVCPLRASGRLMGIMALGVSQELDKITEDQKKLAKRFNGSISVAVENHLLYEQLQQATARLKTQNEKLQELDKIKDEFISMATHQLGTPLTVIDGYITTVLDSKEHQTTDLQKDYLQKALRRVRLMKRLVADFLNISRIEAGHFYIEASEVDLNIIVPEEVNQLSQKAKEKNIGLQFIAPQKPVPVSMLDEQKTRQAIMNLIDNAIYYTPKGQVKVYLESDDKYLIFKVVDSGIGVPESQKAHLFSRFYRAENAKKERPAGTGIGLYLVKRVAEDQGGSIIFESHEGRGSTFGFRVPLKAAPIFKNDLAKSTA